MCLVGGGESLTLQGTKGNIMLTIGYFIEGGEIDQPIIMRQWQLREEARLLISRITRSSSITRLQLRTNRAIWRRFNRRHNVMIDLINAYNEAQEIYRQHGDEIKRAIAGACFKKYVLGYDVNFKPNDN